MKNKLYLLTTCIVLVVLIYTLTPAKKLFEASVSIERSLAGLSLKSVSISEGNISYLEGGAGKTLILLHGFGANKDNWNALAKRLTSHFHIIALDVPGFGGSFKNANLDYDVTAQTRRLDEFVNKLKLTQFYVAGNSMGGYIAGNYAALFPDKILSLWLLNPLGIADSPSSEMFERIGQGKRAIVLANNQTEFEELIEYIFYEVPFMPAFFVEELAKKATRDFPIHSKIFEDLHNITNFQVDFTLPLDDVLEGYPKPVLITWGNKDRILHPAGAKILASVIPKSKIEMMQNIGHVPMIESPTATAEQFILFSQNIR